MMQACSRSWCVALLLVSVFAASVLPAAVVSGSERLVKSAPSLAPYQLVRSLRLLQDQIVTGQPEAIPMLNRMLARVGNDMQQMPQQVWEQPENLYAALIYLLNGGNPEVVRSVLSSPAALAVTGSLAEGALAYVAGDTMKMLQLFSGPLPDNIPAELSASIALVSSHQLAALDPSTALSRLDRVRLQVPGTLFEEAAIRRSLKIAARLGDAGKIRLLSRNYLQRFGKSPYTLDFIQQFVDAILQLNHRISNADVALLAKNAPPSLQYALYLRMARSALVEGQTERARFMSARAKALADQLKADDSQAQLYAAASQVTSVGASEALRELKTIPQERLNASDKELLKAVEAVGNLVMRAPVASSDAAVLIPVTAPAGNIAAQVPIWRQPKNMMDADLQATVDETRRKLLEIDQLLGKATP